MSEEQDIGSEDHHQAVIEAMSSLYHRKDCQKLMDNKYQRAFVAKPLTQRFLLQAFDLVSEGDVTLWGVYKPPKDVKKEISEPVRMSIPDVQGKLQKLAKEKGTSDQVEL